jgi:hypothetical protein
MSNFLAPVFGTEAQHEAYQALLRVKRLNHARDSFARLRFKAALAAIFRGTAKAPKSADYAIRSLHGEVFEVCISAIRGVADGSPDFDSRFRPLKRTQREAWVRAYLKFDCGNYPAPRLRRTAGGFVVEEGVYLLSVMAFLGYEHVQATISGTSPDAEPGASATRQSESLPLATIAGINGDGIASSQTRSAGTEAGTIPGATKTGEMPSRTAQGF